MSKAKAPKYSINKSDFLKYAYSQKELVKKRAIDNICRLASLAKQIVNEAENTEDFEQFDTGYVNDIIVDLDMVLNNINYLINLWNDDILQ